MALVATFARIPDQAQSWQSMVSLVLGMLGGASTQLLLFIFLNSLTGAAWLIETRRLGIAGWILSTPTSTGTLVTILPQLGVLLAFASALTTPAVWQLRRALTAWSAARRAARRRAFTWHNGHYPDA